MENHGIKQPIMPLKYVLIGKALGYPPQAYNDFDIERDDRHIIHYHGSDFVCRKRNMKECVLYMKERYVIPKDLYIEVSIIKPKIKKAVS